MLATGFIGTTAANVLYTKVLEPNLSGYFVLISIVTGVTFSLGVAFNVKVDSVLPDSSYEPIEPTKKSEDGKVDKGEESPQKFWKSPQLYNLMIFTGIGYGFANTQLLLFSTQVESLGLVEDMATILSISPVVSMIGVVIIGIVSDRWLDHFPRINIFCFINIMMIIVLIFWSFIRDDFVMLIILSVANGCFLAASCCLVMAELYVAFGEEAFAMTMGLFYFVGTSFEFGTQFIASTLYDLQLKIQGSEDNICYGRQCFFDWNIIQTVIFGICVILNVVYIYRKKASSQ